MDKKGIITFLDYRVNKIEFVNNKEYNGEEVDIDFDMAVEVHVSEDGQEMIVVLKTNIFDSQEETVYPFKMSVEVEGYFKSNFEGEEQDIKKYVKNAVAILFPYVRSLISTYTANANVTPLILPTINVSKLVEKVE